MPRPSRRSDLLQVLSAAGGVADGAELAHQTSRAALRGCLADGTVVRVGAGVYALAVVGESAPMRSWARWHEGPNEAELAVRARRMGLARSRRGALAGLSAASAHDWAVLREPAAVTLAVQGGRPAKSTDGVALVQRTLAPREVSDAITAPLRTVLDCARALPFAEGLAVADSALRAGAVGQGELREAGERYRGRWVRRVRRVTTAADARAANPFESALRALVLDVPSVSAVSQHEFTDTGFYAQVDLFDPRLGIVFEADSYEFHGSPERFSKDLRRYAELQTRDLMVLPSPGTR